MQILKFVATVAFLFLPLITIAESAAPQSILAKALELKLAEKPQWHRLLHYRRTLLGGWKSEADGENFFVSPKGKTNPQAELIATLNGFFVATKRALQNGIPAQTVRCQFPARWLWLNEQLNLSSFLPNETCKELNDYQNAIKSEVITLVFSSYHVKSPSSVFGHSLLRLGNRVLDTDQQSQQLLDTGVNYAANPTTSNPILYTIFGLTGGFTGTFSKMPYYYKVREYSDFDSRDLWEYELDLTTSERQMLVTHLWELGSTHFDYFYLTENCSYHMLTLLEAAAPRLNLIKHVHGYVIPVDTLKALFFEPGLVKAIHYRPSLHTQFDARVTKLNGKQKNILAQLRTQDHFNQTYLEGLSENESGEVLDAYMDYIDLVHGTDLMEKKSDIVKWKQSVLLARSRLPTAQALNIATPTEDAPHLSHGSTRVSLSQIESQNFKGATEVAVRFALHDLSDSSVGLPPDAEITMFSLDARYWSQAKRLQIENAQLFSVSAYRPLTRFEQSFSWKAELGAKRVVNAACENCNAAYLQAGAGFALNLHRSLLLYALALVEVQVASGFKNDHVITLPGPLIGWRLSFTPNLKLVSEAKYQHSFNAPRFDELWIDSTLRWSLNNSWSLKVQTMHSRFDREISGGFSYYY